MLLRYVCLVCFAQMSKAVKFTVTGSQGGKADTS